MNPITIRLIRALAALLIKVNGKMQQNPYTVPEYREGLEALKEACGLTGSYLDVPVQTLKDYKG